MRRASADWSGGTILQKQLVPGERILVDTTSLLGWSESVKFDIKCVWGSCPFQWQPDAQSNVFPDVYAYLAMWCFVQGGRWLHGLLLWRRGKRSLMGL
jgi:hypothetical protein